MALQTKLWMEKGSIDGTSGEEISSSHKDFGYLLTAATGQKVVNLARDGFKKFGSEGFGQLSMRAIQLWTQLWRWKQR